MTSRKIRIIIVLLNYGGDFMKKFKNLFVRFLIVSMSILCARVVYAQGYKAQLCIGEHYRKGSTDFYAQFNVKNKKGVSTYFVDILKHSSIPIQYNQDQYACKLCKCLLTKCIEKKIDLGKILEIELTKNDYLELFNLSKVIRSKKTNNTEQKIEAFKLLTSKILTLYDIPFIDQ